MITNGEFVSRVVNGLKALSKDTHVSARYIAHIGKVKAKFLMAQKLDELSLFKEEGLITNVNCFRLKRIKARDCGVVEFKLCDKLMKSCEKIPEAMYGKIGPSIFSVISVDGSIDYRYITPRRYSDIKKRKYRKEDAGYFYIKDDYLYLPDSLNELVDMAIITVDKDQAECVSECSEVDSDSCTSKLESTFVCPDRFLDHVVGQTIQEIGTFYRTSTEDENPNLDVHQKTKTTK
jgi:hypothetical protein